MTQPTMPLEMTVNISPKGENLSYTFLEGGSVGGGVSIMLFTKLRNVHSEIRLLDPVI